MEHKKSKIIVISIILFIAIIMHFNNSEFCFADEGNAGSGWTPISTNEELVAAFKAYCKTRNLDTNHTPNILHQIVAWDYSNMSNLAKKANIDLDLLNAHIWYAYNNNNKIKWFIDKTGVTNLSLLYATLLEEYNLSENQNKTLYEGRWFQDDNNDGCFVYETTSSYINHRITSDLDFESHVKRGSIFKNTTGKLLNVHMSDGEVQQNILTENNITYNYFFKCTKNWNNTNGQNYIQMKEDNNFPNTPSQTFFNDIYIYDNYYKTIDSHLTVIYNTENRKFYLGFYSYFNYYNRENNYFLAGKVELTNPTTTNHKIDGEQGAETTPPENKSLTINSDDDTINNFITNNYTNITYNYDDDDEPPSQPPYTDPYGDNPTGTNIDPNGDINWTMPDLNIDWELPDELTDIFPFSIPFDIIDFFDILDSEPVAPHFEGTIDLGIINYDLDVDLSYFDDVAAYFRAFILAFYTFGLIIATRALFHII